MTDSYPALIELISRLEGKDKKTCELALYCLNKADKRDAKLRAQNENIQSAAEYYKGKWKKAADGIDKLRAALNPFVVDDWVEYATFTGGYLRDAATAYKETSDADT